MKILFSTLLALFVLLTSLNASAHYNGIDSGIHSIAFAAATKGEPKEGEEEEPDCD